jgi:hypothetical protein
LPSAGRVGPVGISPERMLGGSPAEELIRAAGPYRPRPLSFLGREQLDDWRLKVYGIAASGDRPRDELVRTTLAVADAELPRPAVDDGRYGVGFVIAHDAAAIGIALVYWWQSSNELHQRVYSSPRDDLAAMTKMVNPAAGCVWELGVIDFERRAWLEDVLTNPDGPDLDAYLARELNTEF